MMDRLANLVECRRGKQAKSKQADLRDKTKSHALIAIIDSATHNMARRIHSLFHGSDQRSNQVLHKTGVLIAEECNETYSQE